jgi:hypothetical protein
MFRKEVRVVTDRSQMYKGRVITNTVSISNAEVWFLLLSNYFIY